MLCTETYVENAMLSVQRQTIIQELCDSNARAIWRCIDLDFHRSGGESTSAWYER